MYQTQETLAKETIIRLKNAGADSVCLWLHTSQLTAENKNINKLNMIAHLLKPLEKTTVYRPFFLCNNDILLIGTPDLPQSAEPQIERIRRVLSDDTFIQTAGRDFFTIYPILTHADLLVSALSSHNSTPVSFDNTTVWEQITPRLKSLSPIDVLRPRTVLHLTPQGKKTICRLYLPNRKKLTEALRLPPNALSGTIGVACIRHIWEQNDSLFQTYNANSLPSFIYFNVSDIIKAGFDLFMQARTGKTVICLSAEDILSDNPDTNKALKKLHANRVSWALTSLNSETWEWIDYTKIKPDFVCVPYSDTVSTDLPTGLKKDKIILTHIHSQEKLLDALRLGYSYFSGAVIDLILGSVCQKQCPYGDTCAPDLCKHIWTDKIPDTQCVFSDFRTKFIYEECEDI